MFKRIKLLLVTSILMSGLLLPAVPVQVSAAQTGRNLSDKNGLKPFVAIPVDSASASKDKYFHINDNIKQEDREYWTKFSNDFYYNQLNTAEKNFWDALENVCLTYATTTATYPDFQWVSYAPSISEKRMKDIMFTFIYSNPQYYFLDANIMFYTDGSNKASLTMYNFFEDGATRATYTEEFTSKIDAWVTEIMKENTPEQRFKRAHDIVCLHTEYGENLYDQSAYSMVCLEQTVCAGYTKALSILGNAVGVETCFETSSNHAWNIVNLYGVWYQTDATWADTDYDSEIYYDYYNKSRSTMLANDALESHVTVEMLQGMKAYCPYDMMVFSMYYTNPCFTSDSNTYFIVNANPDLGEPIVRCLGGSSVLPASVTYNDMVYTVIGGSDNSTGGTSDEAVARVKAFVERMYTVALERDADASGVDFWTNLLVTKTADGASLSKEFLLGQEFTAKNYNDDEFIKVLYNTFFNRTADADGLAYWKSIIDAGNSREAVLAGFVNSAEFFSLCGEYGITRGYLLPDGNTINSGIYQFAERLYSKILERGGDKDGIEHWTLALYTRECTPEIAAISFFNGDEYLNKQTNDEQYIMALYRTFMGREADADGLIAWKNSIGSGTNRQTILSSFAQSAEFKAIMTQYGL